MQEDRRKTGTFFQVLRCSMHQLQGNQLETTLLEARDDGANERALDAIRLIDASIRGYTLSRMRAIP